MKVIKKQQKRSLDENGINTYYRQGKYLINNKTGERIRIKQKKKRASQFKIIKK